MVVENDAIGLAIHGLYIAKARVTDNERAPCSMVAEGSYSAASPSAVWSWRSLMRADLPRRPRR